MQLAKITDISSLWKESWEGALSRTVDDKYWQIGEKAEEVTPHLSLLHGGLRAITV
jgi:hypothetical protein